MILLFIMKLRLALLKDVPESSNRRVACTTVRAITLR